MPDHKDEMRALLVDRVDLVKAPANRMPLLLRKQDGSTQNLAVHTTKEVPAMAKDEKLLTRLVKALGLDTPDPADVAKKAAEEGVDALTDDERSILLEALTPENSETDPPESTDPPEGENETPAEAVVKAVGEKITEALAPVTKQVTDLAGELEKVAKADALEALGARVEKLEKVRQGSRALKGQEDGDDGEETQKGDFTGVLSTPRRRK